MISAISRWFAALLLGTLMLAGITGCDGSRTGSSSQNQTTTTQGLRTIEGMAYLSAEDPLTSHGGILVYLAGTGHQARTDRTGKYRIDNVPTGAYEMVAEKAGFKPATFDTIAVDAAANGSVPLRPKIPFLEKAGTAPAPEAQTTEQPGSLSGIVLLQAAEDYSGVRVQVDGTQLVTATDADGLYRLANLQPGTYNLLFSKEGYNGSSINGVRVQSGANTEVAEHALEKAVPRVVMRSAQPSPATNVSAPPLTIAGGDRVISGIVQVIDEAGNAVTDYSKVVVAINDTDLIATPDAQGRFEFAGLAPNVYTVLGTLDQGEPVRMPVDLRTEPSAAITLKISPTADNSGVGIVRGKMILPGADDLPLADATGVRVAIAGTQISAVTAADGTFEMRDVPVGTYAVSASKEDFEDFTQEGVAVSAGQTVELGELTMEPSREYPRVIGTTPASGTTNIPVSLDLVLQVRFSKKMDVNTVRNALSINPPVAAQILMGKGTHPMADDDNLVIVISNMDEKIPIKFGTSYRLTVTKAATDFEGLAMREDFTMTFGTGAPGLIGTQPANGARDVYVDQNDQPVILNFNTRLDPESLNSRSIRVKPDNGMSVQVTWTNDPRTGWTNVRVATNWQQDTQYTITIGRDVKAYNGQPLGNTPYTLRFRTGVLQVLQAPIQVIR